MVHHPQVNVIYDILKNEGLKSNDHSIEYRKSIWQNSTAIHDKSSQKLCLKRLYLNILKPYITSPQLTSYSIGKRNKTRMTTVAILMQYNIKILDRTGQ